jgi:hypothetical protein
LVAGDTCPWFPDTISTTFERDTTCPICSLFETSF